MCARLLGTCLVALTLAAGCSSQAEEPSVLPRVTVSPSPTPSAAVVVVPTAAQAATPQGAAAFARFFYAEVERAFAAKDPEIIRRLSAPGCEACELFEASLRSLRDEGHRVSDVSFEVVVAEAPGITGSEARVDVIYNTKHVQRFDSAGKLIYEEPAVEGDEVQLTLVRGASGWLVKAVEDV